MASSIRAVQSRISTTGATSSTASTRAANTAPAAPPSSAAGSPRSPPADTAGSSGMRARSGAPISLGQALAAARPEQVVVLAVVAGEAAHVLDDAGYPEVPLAGHVGGPHGHLLGGQRRGGHDEHLGPGQHPGQPHLDVARPGRHVHQQVVEVAPGHVLEEVLDAAQQHRAPAT